METRGKSTVGQVRWEGEGGLGQGGQNLNKSCLCFEDRYTARAPHFAVGDPPRKGNRAPKAQEEGFCAGKVGPGTHRQKSRSENETKVGPR